MTEPCTIAFVAPCTSKETTDRSTRAPAMMDPAPTIESTALPFSENFAGGSEGGFVRSGHSRL